VNGLLKFGLIKMGASTNFVFSAAKVAWQMGVQTNLQSFFVRANSGYAIFTYPIINLM
jgi:hypothetical protein